MTKFGEILAELRKDKGLRQKELAEMLHVSSSTISNYEIGAHYPDIEKLMELADYFNVTTDYLLGRCASNLSPDVFDKPVSPEMTIGELITSISRLFPRRKQILLGLLSELSDRDE
jgi:transcriptional regulator with XRE-family HTH domain